MDPLLIILCIAAVIVGIPFGKKLVARAGKITDKKKAALSLALALRNYGMRTLPSVLESFAVGDVPDLLTQISDLSRMIEQGNDAVIKDLERTFDSVLDRKLRTPEGLLLIKAKIAEAEARKV